MNTVSRHNISPRFTAEKASPGTFLDWVEIWEDRMNGWLVVPAKRLRDAGPQFSIASLYLSVAFLEPYEVFRRGEDSYRRSEEFFCAAFKRIFQESRPIQPPEVWDSVAREMYREVRCGLFHSAMPGTKVYLANTVQGIHIQYDQATLEVDRILLNPAHFLEAVELEIGRYVEMLRDDSQPGHPDLRANFERAWHLVHRPRSQGLKDGSEAV